MPKNPSRRRAPSSDAPADPSTGAQPASSRTGNVRADLLARMGHELRTPLNAIIGFVRLVEDGLYATEEERRDYLASARQSAMGLLDLINNILDLARIESGRLSLESVELNVRELAEEVVRTLAPEAHAKGVEIEALVHPEVPAWLKSDPMRLRQVLYNLAGNAVKFTARGLVMLAVAPEPGSEEAGCRLRFTVHDTGMGVPEEVRRDLFESFVQKQFGESGQSAGVGLGLSISRQIVEQMGGAIEYTSVEGEGSTFWFVVTLHRGRANGAEAPAVPAELTGRAVLLLNPDEATREIYRDRLSGLGLAPQVAASPEAALALLQAAADGGAPVSLALVDHHLPRDDMLFFARAVRRRAERYQPALVSLAPLGRVADVGPLREAGFTQFLTKPVLPEALGNALAAQVRELGPVGAMKPQARAASHRPGAPAPDYPAQVLVAEDNLVNQKLILALLTKDGYAARIVPNGQAAVEALRGDRFDLVLMDVQMPVMDGLTATRAIRALPAGQAVPIIAMTADGLDGDRERCLEVGMDDYVPKPIMPDLLQDKLRQWLRYPRAGAPANGHGADPEDLAPLLDEPHLESVRAYANRHEPQRFQDWLNRFRTEARAALAVLGDPALREDTATLTAAARHLAQSSAGFGAPRLLRQARRLAQYGSELAAADRDALVHRLEVTFRGVDIALAERFGPSGVPAP